MLTRGTKEVSPSITEAIIQCLQKWKQAHGGQEKTLLIAQFFFLQMRWLILTLHELVGSGNIELASPEEAQQQRVWFVPEALQHQFGQLVSLHRSVLHRGPKVLQRGRPPLLRLTQLILRLEEEEKQPDKSDTFWGTKCYYNEDWALIF